MLRRKRNSKVLPLGWKNILVLKEFSWNVLSATYATKNKLFNFSAPTMYSKFNFCVINWILYFNHFNHFNSALLPPAVATENFLVYSTKCIFIKYNSTTSTTQWFIQNHKIWEILSTKSLTLLGKLSNISLQVKIVEFLIISFILTINCHIFFFYKLLDCFWKLTDKWNSKCNICKTN